MSGEYTTIIKQDGEWWIGWIEGIPGINCQERTHAELIEILFFISCSRNMGAT